MFFSGIWRLSTSGGSVFRGAMRCMGQLFVAMLAAAGVRLLEECAKQLGERARFDVCG